MNQQQLIELNFNCNFVYYVNHWLSIKLLLLLHYKYEYIYIFINILINVKW